MGRYSRKPSHFKPNINIHHKHRLVRGKDIKNLDEKRINFSQKQFSSLEKKNPDLKDEFEVYNLRRPKQEPSKFDSFKAAENKASKEPSANVTTFKHILRERSDKKKKS